MQWDYWKQKINNQIKQAQFDKNLSFYTTALSWKYLLLVSCLFRFHKAVKIIRHVITRCFIFRIVSRRGRIFYKNKFLFKNLISADLIVIIWYILPVARKFVRSCKDAFRAISDRKTLQETCKIVSFLGPKYFRLDIVALNRAEDFVFVVMLINAPYE